MSSGGDGGGGWGLVGAKLNFNRAEEKLKLWCMKCRKFIWAGSLNRDASADAENHRLCSMIDAADPLVILVIGSGIAI